MNLFSKLVTLILGVLLGFSVFASAQNFTQPAIVFEVNNDSLSLNNTNIESASSLSLDDETKNEYGLHLKLTKEATNQLTKMASQNIGQQLSITINGRLVSSPTISGALGSEFWLSGLTKEEAESVVESIKKTNP